MVQIVDIVLSPPGPDTQDKLNQEVVILQNQGTKSVNMRSWFLTDEKGHRYTFSDVLADRNRWTLDPREFIVLHTGRGNDQYVPPTQKTFGTFHLYWGRDWYVWNNEGDTAYLFDQAGNLVSKKRVRGAA